MSLYDQLMNQQMQINDLRKKLNDIERIDRVSSTAGSNSLNLPIHAFSLYGGYHISNSKYGSIMYRNNYDDTAAISLVIEQDTNITQMDIDIGYTSGSTGLAKIGVILYLFKPGIFTNSLTESASNYELISLNANRFGEDTISLDVSSVELAKFTGSLVIQRLGADIDDTLDSSFILLFTRLRWV